MYVAYESYYENLGKYYREEHKKRDINIRKSVRSFARKIDNCTIILCKTIIREVQGKE